MEKNRGHISLLFWLTLSVATSAVIFCFSAQPAAESNGVSTGFTKWLLDTLLGTYPEQTLLLLNNVMRKLAHFTIYAFLGVCLTGVYQHQHRHSKFALAVLTSAVYAALDEFHQSFVPGRGPQVTDVLLDTAGAATGALVMAGALLLLGRNYQKKAKDNETE